VEINKTSLSQWVLILIARLISSKGRFCMWVIRELDCWQPAVDSDTSIGYICEIFHPWLSQFRKKLSSNHMFLILHMSPLQPITHCITHSYRLLTIQTLIWLCLWPIQVIVCFQKRVYVWDIAKLQVHTCVQSPVRPRSYTRYMHEQIDTATHRHPDT